MREIKFRAWDEKKKVMFVPSSINWKFIGGQNTLWVCDAHGENKLEYELVNPNAHLMQFTGLQDKKGVDIYEGDRVLTTSGIYEIKSLEYFYWIQFDDQMHIRFTDADDKPNCEVINNIYEKSELQ